MNKGVKILIGLGVILTLWFAWWFIMTLASGLGIDVSSAVNPPEPQNIHFTVTNGRVVDNNNNPISGALVSIDYLCLPKSYSQKREIIKHEQMNSDNAGEFHFNSFNVISEGGHCEKLVSAFKVGYCGAGSLYDGAERVMETMRFRAAEAQWCASINTPTFDNQSHQKLKMEEIKSPDLMLFFPVAKP